MALTKRLYVSIRPRALSYLFQQFRRQNVSDRLANGRTISFHHGQTSLAVFISNSGFLCLITARWYTQNSFREWLWVWCERGKKRDKLGESSINIHHKAWDVLGRRVRDAYPLSPESLADLTQRLVIQWNLIDHNEVNKLCNSMPQRLRACIAANGGLEGIRDIKFLFIFH